MALGVEMSERGGATAAGLAPGRIELGRRIAHERQAVGVERRVVADRGHRLLALVAAEPFRERRELSSERERDAGRLVGLRHRDQRERGL